MEDKGVVKTAKGEFKASEYQSKIFEEIHHGVRNMVITAAAGSAKTTTIENCLRFIPEGKRILYVAFNVSTVDKLKSEIVDREGVEIYTFHGLGARVLRENGISVSNIDDFKYQRYLNENIMSLTRFGETASLGDMELDYMDNIALLINYSRYYLKMTEREIAEVAEIYGVVPQRDEYEVVRKCLIWGKDNLDKIDHTDLIWLPNVLNLTTRRYIYDYVFIDEAQDMTFARQGLVDKTFGRGARFIAVGDKKQQINVWCGATEESLDTYTKRPNTVIFTLPISYRIPKIIEPIAQRYSPDIIAGPDAAEGEIRHDVSANDARPGDLVLCRMSSNLVELYLEYVRNNMKAYLKGYDVYKKEYLELLDRFDSERIDLFCATENGLMPRLYKYFFEFVESLEKKLNIGEEEAFRHPESITLFDKIQAIRVLSGGLKTVEELRNKIDCIFTGDKEDAITLSTVHKAKGLEAENVFILAPSLLENPIFAVHEWERTMERNLAYVAITRASKTLNFIKEEEKGFFYNFKKDKLREGIGDIRAKINYYPDEDKIDQNTPATQPVKIVKQEEQKKGKKKKGGLKFGNLLDN